MFIIRDNGADGSRGGVGCHSSGDDGDGFGGEEGFDCRREPGLAEREKEMSRRRHSSTFRHSDWRIKGIIPSTPHPNMLRYLENAMPHHGLEHFINAHTRGP